jgi:hypothetical protein
MNMHGTFTDTRISKRKSLLYLTLLIPGTAVYLFYVFVLASLASAMFTEKPTNVFTYVVFGLLLLSIAFAAVLAKSLFLNLFRVSRIEFRPDTYLVTYALGPSTAFVGSSKLTGEGFLVDLYDEENWGCMANVFLNGKIPFVVSRSMENSNGIFAALMKHQPPAKAVGAR